LLFGVFSAAPSASLFAQAGQQSEQKRSVSGTVTSIGSDAMSFSMEVDEAGNKRTMQFTVNQETQIQGQVGVGTMATVEYQPSEGGQGQNVALNVTPRAARP
jgi:hypothetical protein